MAGRNQQDCLQMTIAERRVAVDGSAQVTSATMISSAYGARHVLRLVESLSYLKWNSSASGQKQVEELRSCN